MSNAPPASDRLPYLQKGPWLRRLAGLAAPPRTAQPTAGTDAEAAATGVLNLQVWMDQAAWRPAGLWTFAAGLLASGALRLAGDLNWQALALLALLVDAIWGGIWRLAGGRSVLLTLPARSGASAASPAVGGAGASNAPFSLPYLQEGSPAARLLAGDHTDVWAPALRVGAPVALLALGVSALLGVYALGLTLLVIVLAALGWTLRRSVGHPALLLHSVVAVGLPWILTVQQAQPAGAVAWLPQLLLPGFWVLHHWGALRTSHVVDQWGLLLMAVAQIGICGLLIAVQSPLWLAPLILLLLPNWLLAFTGQPLRRLRLLWLAAMLLSAAALGQTVGI
jgi:hypothetical protein